MHLIGVMAVVWGENHRGDIEVRPVSEGDLNRSHIALRWPLSLCLESHDVLGHS